MWNGTVTSKIIWNSNSISLYSCMHVIHMHVYNTLVPISLRIVQDFSIYSLGITSNVMCPSKGVRLRRGTVTILSDGK